MTVVAILGVKNEAGIIATTISHLLAEGVDHLLVNDGFSTDGTRDILATFPEVIVTDEPPGTYDQSAIMSTLAAQACELGADWVLPVDADEFPYATEGGTIADTLDRLPADIGQVYLRMFLHTDWDHRLPDPKPLAKVAFRAQPGAVVHFGNHGVNLDHPGVGVWGVLDLREWQYRSWEHFCEKVDRARSLFANNPGMDPLHGTHMRRLAAMTDDELDVEWKEMCAVPVVVDPIPSPLNEL